MRPPSSSKPRSPTTDAIQSAGPAHAAQALLPRTTPSPRLASPGRGLLRRPGADGASALRQRVAPVARLVRAGRAVLEGRALAADRSHPTQLGSGRSHAVD